MKLRHWICGILVSILALAVGLLPAQGPVDVQEHDARQLGGDNRVGPPDAGDDEGDDEGADELGHRFTLGTDKTTYDLCDTVEVTFTYALDPATSVTTREGGELGCNFLLSLEDCSGNVLLDSEDLVGPIGCDDVVECSEEGVITRTVEIPLCGSGEAIGCGIYRVRAVTRYLRSNPDNPDGVFGCGPEAVIPVVVCEDSPCAF